MRVLTWNLMHGRAVPPAGRNLFEEFSCALEGWEWDVALLQEVPPWWPQDLAKRLGSDQRTVLTSRNSLLAVRRAIANRWPDAIKSNGGGSNAILARGDQLLEYRTRRLCRLPERRWLQAARLEQAGLWVGNLHLTVHDDAAARREADLAARTILELSAHTPTVLGGDFNVRELTLERFHYAGGHDVDHVFTTWPNPRARPEVLERGRLSDHAPVLISLA
jgi:endonuclease/exonuclease/phosphatase family metal-dependent hydrolase